MLGIIESPAINNLFYEQLGERWYSDDQHVIALLRAESKLKLDYIQGIFANEKIDKGKRVLDIGCGAGFLSNALAAKGFDVYGLDQSPDSIAVAQRHAVAGSLVNYAAGDAFALKHPDGFFDSVLLMDFLEHVNEPERAIQEASRVLKPGGIMIFYTFNRTRIAKFLAIDAVEFMARDCPKNFHVWHLFIKPQELEGMVAGSGLAIREFQGLRPKIFSWPFWSSLLTRRVHPGFGFQFTSSLALGYLGFARKLRHN